MGPYARESGSMSSEKKQKAGACAHEAQTRRQDKRWRRHATTQDNDTQKRECAQKWARSPVGKGERRTFTTTSLPLMVTEVLSGTSMVCFPIRDILAVVCTVVRLTAAVRGFARLNLAVVANMLCGSVDCCGDSGEGIHRRDDQKIERRNNVHNVRGGGMSHANAAVMRCRPDVAIAHNHALVSVSLYISLSLSVSLCHISVTSLSHLCHKMGTRESEDLVPKRVEEALFYRLKNRAFEECGPLARAYADCCAGRVISLVYKCRDEGKALSACMTQVTGRLGALKREWLVSGRKTDMNEDEWSELLGRVIPPRERTNGRTNEQADDER